MDFKKKAGLALALAAIFTTGGANLALATGNETASVGSGSSIVGNSDIGTDTVVTVTGKDPALNGGDGSQPVKNMAVSADSTVATVQGVLPLLGDGGALLPKGDNGKSVDTVAVGAATLAIGDSENSASGGSLDQVTVSTGKIAVSGGQFAANKISVTGAGKVLVGAESDGTTPVDTDAPIIVNIAELNLANGSTFMVDPLWQGNGVYNAAEVGVANFGGNGRANGVVAAGENSQLTLGYKDGSWLSNILKTADSGESIWSTDGAGATGITAALGLFTPQLTLNTAGLHVDGLATVAGAPTNTDTVVLKNQSLFAVNLTTLNGTGSALHEDDGAGTKQAIGTVQIGTDAAATGDTRTTFYGFNAQHNGTYTIIENASVIEMNNNTTLAIGDNVVAEAGVGKQWVAENLLFSSDLVTGTWSVVDGDMGGTEINLVLSVARSDVEVQEAYGRLSGGMAGMVDNLYGNDADDGQNNVFFGTTGNTFGISGAAAGSTGIAFVSRATDNYFMPDHELAAATLEGAAQIAVAAGVPFITNNVVTRIADMVVDHNNLLNDTQPAYGNEPGSFGIWANPFYATGDTDGMDAGRFQNGFDYNYGGAAFGIDYNINEAFRLGLALNVGGGDSDSEDGNSDFNTTNADFDFFGVSLYGSYTNGAFGLTGDLGFTGVDYEIDQNLPGSMGMGNLESDVDTNAFTLGLTGQYRFAASDNFNITPHLGLRFTQISVDDSDVNLRGGGRVFDVSTEDQNLFQIPLGVEFSSNIVTDGGWTITPSADLGVLFTAGDTDVETRARIAGANFSTGAMNADVNDSAAFQGRLGIKAAADNGLSLGLDYGILAGGNQTDHQFSGMLRFEF